MAYPKGAPKVGGRQKGTPNKATAAKAADIASSGLTPLDFMLNALRDEARDYDARFEAAKAAAPYVHPKLAATMLDLGKNTIDLLADIIANRRQRVAEIDNGQ